MNTIESQIPNVNWSNHDDVIRFYENNHLYADALTRKAHYDKSSSALDTTEGLLKRLDPRHPNYVAIERQCRYLRGIVLGEKKEFVKAYGIFTQLLREDPDHHYYKVWHTHTFQGLYNWVFNILYTIGTVLTLSDLLFRLNKVWPFDPGMIGIALIAVAFVSQRGLHEYIKRKEIVSIGLPIIFPYLPLVRKTSTMKVTINVLLLLIPWLAMSQRHNYKTLDDLGWEMVNYTIPDKMTDLDTGTVTYLVTLNGAGNVMRLKVLENTFNPSAERSWRKSIKDTSFRNVGLINQTTNKVTGTTTITRGYCNDLPLHPGG